MESAVGVAPPALDADGALDAGGQHPRLSMAFIDGPVVNVACRRSSTTSAGARDPAVGRQRLPAHARVADLVGGSLGDIFRGVAGLRDRGGELRRASVLCAVAPNALALIVFRGIQGMAGALLVPASLAMLTATFTGTARGNAIGHGRRGPASPSSGRRSAAGWSTSRRGGSSSSSTCRSRPSPSSS